MTTSLQRIFLITSVLLVLVNCSSLPLSKPKPPVVSIASVVPLNLSLTSQKLSFKLKVFNPNPYSVPLESLDFTASLMGKEMATGNSDQKVTLPANGYEFVDVEVAVGINKLLGQVKSFFDSPDMKMGYKINGFVKVANWPRKIPFDVDGAIKTDEEVDPPQKL